MASDDRQILAAILARLVAINGAGSYTFDFSATDKAAISEPPVIPPILNYACCWWIGQKNADGDSLGEFTTRSEFGFALYVQATGDTVAAHVNAALDAAEDARIAFETSRTLGGLVWDLKVDAVQDMTSEALDLPEGVTFIAGVLSTVYQRAAAT